MESNPPPSDYEGDANVESGHTHVDVVVSAGNFVLARFEHFELFEFRPFRAFWSFLPLGPL